MKRAKQGLLIRINQPATLYLLIWWRHLRGFVFGFLSCEYSRFPRITSPFLTPLGKCELQHVVSSRYRFIPLSSHPSRIPCGMHLPSWGGSVRMSVTSFLIRNFGSTVPLRKLHWGGGGHRHFSKYKAYVSETPAFVHLLLKQ